MNPKQHFRLKKLAATLLLLILLLGGVLVVRADEAKPGTRALPGSVDLRPQWTAGQTARYEFWNRMEQTADIKLGDQSRTQTGLVEVEGEVTWIVEKVKPDGSSTATMTLDWMRYANTPGSPASPETGPAMTVDSRRSATAETKPMHELLSAMVGVPLVVELAPDGHVTQVKGIDKIKRKTSQPDFVPSELDFEETASDLASIAFAPPPMEIASPKGWDAAFRWDHEMGKMDQDWSYRLDRVEEIAGVPVAVITGEATFKLDAEQPEMPAGSPPVDVKLLEGTAESEVLFDLSRREAVGRHSTTVEKIRITVPFPDGRKFERTLTEETVGQVLRLSED